MFRRFETNNPVLRTVGCCIRYLNCIGFARYICLFHDIRFHEKGEIDLANSKIITLRAHFGPPPGAESSPGQSLAVPNSGQLNYSEQDRLIDLQQLAISTRSIYGRSQQLRWLIVPALPDPFQKIRG